jgi:hypothetical protein
LNDDGSILAGGRFTCGEGDQATSDFALLKLNGNGLLDSGFGTGGFVYTDLNSTVDEARGLVIDRNHRIVLAGTAASANGQSRNFALARYNSDGNPDLNLDPTVLRGRPIRTEPAQLDASLTSGEHPISADPVNSVLSGREGYYRIRMGYFDDSCCSSSCCGSSCCSSSCYWSIDENSIYAGGLLGITDSDYETKYVHAGNFWEAIIRAIGGTIYLDTSCNPCYTGEQESYSFTFPDHASPSDDGVATAFEVSASPVSGTYQTGHCFNGTIYLDERFGHSPDPGGYESWHFIIELLDPLASSKYGMNGTSIVGEYGPSVVTVWSGSPVSYEDSITSWQIAWGDGNTDFVPAPSGAKQHTYAAGGPSSFTVIGTGGSSALWDMDANENLCAHTYVKTFLIKRVPMPPSALEAIAANDREVNLSWTDNSHVEDGFSIERSQDGVTYQQIDEVPANFRAYTAIGLLPEMTYYFRVRARAGDLYSAYTSADTATTFETFGTPQLYGDASIDTGDATIIHMGVPYIGELGTQPQTVHGMSVLLPAQSEYTFGFDYSLATWDSYNPHIGGGTGYWDVFSVSVTDRPYSSMALTDPLSASSFPFMWHGSRWGDAVLESASGSASEVFAGNPSGDNYLNVILDTRADTERDQNYPSWGTIAVTAGLPLAGRPNVSIAATTPEAYRTGLVPGIFSVSRNGQSTASPLTVYYTVAGTATAGSDYQTIGGSVTIPAGADHAEIYVTPLAGAPAGSETVIVVLTASGDYRLSTDRWATVDIVGNEPPVQCTGPAYGQEGTEVEFTAVPSSQYVSVQPTPSFLTAGGVGRMPRHEQGFIFSA